jgi:ornithine decarboxylase
MSPRRRIRQAVRAASPDAEMLYMHPVKAQSDIRLALETYGIRVMSLDHEDEIAKVLRIVRALDLDPHDDHGLRAAADQGTRDVRIVEEVRRGAGHAVELVQRLHNIGFKVGLCFHVGSQVEEAGDLREGAQIRRLGAQPGRGAARRARCRRRVSRGLRP